jgi:hypothetical protein
VNDVSGAIWLLATGGCPAAPSLVGVCACVTETKNTTAKNVARKWRIAVGSPWFQKLSRRFLGFNLIDA